MEEKNIQIMLNTLNNYIVNNENNKDIFIVKRVYNFLKNFDKKSIILNELDNIKKDVLFLETTQEEFFDIANYFDPIYFSSKNLLHKKEVEKLREENRKKREAL